MCHLVSSYVFLVMYPIAVKPGEKDGALNVQSVHEANRDAMRLHPFVRLFLRAKADVRTQPEFEFSEPQRREKVDPWCAVPGPGGERLNEQIYGVMGNIFREVFEMCRIVFCLGKPG